MSERIKNNTVKSCLIIFTVLILVHGFEAIFLRMDETVLGENFINKVFGIIMIVVILKLINWKGEDIGFKKGLITGYGLKSIGLGLLLAYWRCRNPYRNRFYTYVHFLQYNKRNHGRRNFQRTF